MLDFDLFTRVIDEAGPSLGRVDFFNYGEAFLHKRAVEMCEYIKTKFPHIYLYTSTNGLALNEEKARRLVHSGIDEVTFSIDGASQDTYVRYRQRGKFDLATANLRAMADEKAKARPRRAAAQLALHPLQVERLATRRWRRRGGWPPSSASIASPGRSPTIPRTAFSRRFAPGHAPTSSASSHEVWDHSGLGNAIPGATPRAEIAVRAPTRALSGRAGRDAHHPDAREEPLDAAVPQAGQLRPAPRAPRRAAGRRRRHAHQPRPRPRLAARRHPGGRRGRRHHRGAAAERARAATRSSSIW